VVLKGDLSATPLPDVLATLGADGATGCLHIDDEAGDEALVYFKNGLVYAAHVPGRRPQLGARLISSGALAPEALAEALEAQATELQGWRLGELLVHLGYVERPVVEAFVMEQLRESFFDLSRWPSGRFRFRKNEKTREDVGTHAEVADLLAEAVRRRAEWEVISDVVHGPTAVPVLSTGGAGAAEMTLDQDQWALLCKVDGERTIAQLARDCGFTTFEAGHIVFSLVGAGLLDVEETIEDEPADAAIVDDADLGPVAAAIAAVLSGEDRDSAVSRISSALVVPLVADDESDDEPVNVPDGEPDEESEVSRLLSGMLTAEPVAEPEPEPVAEAEPEPEPEAAEDLALPDDLHSELASLTAAIADLPSLALPASFEPDFPTMAGDEPVAPEPAVAAEHDPFGDSLARVSEALSALLGDALPVVSLPPPPEPVGPTEEELAAARAEAERLERSRAAAAAELAEAHALAEASRQGRPSRFGRRAKNEPTEAERLAAERLAAEQAAAQAAADEAARLEAERVAAEQAAADEAARAEAERLAAEEAARAEAERVAAEEAARAEAERAETERLAAEEAARAEAERLAAEQAAADEAARLEAERVAAEEAERAEAERIAAEQAAADEAARAEAERAAAEEAARVEAERVAAEQAAADEAARGEAERAAAEQAAADEAVRAEAERAAAEAVEQAAEEVADEVADEVAEEPVDTFEVTSFLRDLNDSPADTVETVEEYVPDDPAPAPTGADPAPAFANGSRAGLSETAALLRELTSLGLDDEPAPAASSAGTSAAAARATSNANKDQPKKRKGLFGRG
jgi:hypothetical protein